jgi:hypothetical protein
MTIAFPGEAFERSLMDRLLVITWVVLLACVAIAREGDWKAPNTNYVAANVR